MRSLPPKSPSRWRGDRRSARVDRSVGRIAEAFEIRRCARPGPPDPKGMAPTASQSRLVGHHTPRSSLTILRRQEPPLQFLGTVSPRSASGDITIAIARPDKLPPREHDSHWTAPSLWLTGLQKTSNHKLIELASTPAIGITIFRAVLRSWILIGRKASFGLRMEYFHL